MGKTQAIIYINSRAAFHVIVFFGNVQGSVLLSGQLFNILIISFLSWVNIWYLKLAIFHDPECAPNSEMKLCHPSDSKFVFSSAY